MALNGCIQIAGKSALVTGGASGIGLCCVRELLRSDARQVALCDIDDVTAFKVLKDLTAEFGPDRVIFIHLDVTKTDELEDAFQQAVTAFNGLDVVLCLAGIVNDTDWKREIASNFTAIVSCTLLALKYMGKDQGGRGGIVCNTSAVLGLRVIASIPVYTATMHGIVGLCRSIGLPYHFNRTGVRVVAMCPGLTDTASTRSAPIGLLDEKWRDQMEHDMVTNLSQKPENVAVGMMTLIREAKSGSIWVSEGEQSVYEVDIPHYEQHKVKA